MKLGIVLAGLMMALAGFAAETGAELFQRALTAERAAGNLEEAIKLYQRIAKEFASDRALAAKALVQEGRCYEKLGKDNAVRIYEQVAREYKDQRDPSAQAAARLAVLKAGDRPAGPAGMTQRKIALPSENRYYVSDGQRLFSWDISAGRMLVSDLAGKGERTIFRLNAGDQARGAKISRDFSVGLLVFRRASAIKLAVLRMDGTGYREISSVSPSNGCDPDFSWDNRYVFLCTTDPDGSQQLVRVSLADGEVRKVRAADSLRNRPSPDGRFIALGEKLYTPGKVSVVSSQGGEPQLVSDNARFLDWTRDGRYLIIDSARSGSEALYLVPLKDGRPSGDPIFLNYGSCAGAGSTPAGALNCAVDPPGGSEQFWLGTLDSQSRHLDWKQLNLRGQNGGIGYIRWSPDSTQISYGVYDTANSAVVLLLRNVASGKEREIYRGAMLNCIWATHRPALFCGQWGSGQLSTIALDSGRLEPLGVAGAVGTLFFSSDDDRSLYMGDDHLTLLRWDAVTQQSTPVGPNMGFGGRPAPNEHWLARGKDTIDPADGGG